MSVKDKRISFVSIQQESLLEVNDHKLIKVVLYLRSFLAVLHSIKLYLCTTFSLRTRETPVSVSDSVKKSVKTAEYRNE